MKNTDGTYVTFVIPIKTPFNVDENSNFFIQITDQYNLSLIVDIILKI